VGKSPGGIEDGLLNIVLGPEIELDGEQVGTLKDANINALWAPPRNELCVWGVRTLEPEGEGDYLYINSRRTVDYTATIVAANLWWVVFENNDPTLRTRAKEQVLQILRRGFTAGLYKGASEEEAFELLVPAPEQGGPQNLFDVEIGVAVNDPAEFVRVKIRKLLS
jgi:phage tail sheath protein FI